MRALTRMAISTLAQIYRLDTGLASQQGKTVEFGAMATKVLEDGVDSDIINALAVGNSGLKVLAGEPPPGGETPMGKALGAYITALYAYVFSGAYANMLNVLSPQGEARTIGEMTASIAEAIASGDTQIAALADAVAAQDVVVGATSVKGADWLAAAKVAAELSEDDVVMTALGHKGCATGMRLISPSELATLAIADGMVGRLGSVLNTKTMTESSKAGPQIGVVQIMDPTIQFGQAAQGLVSVFLNHMPAIEMSRCAPYFRLGITNELAPLSPTGEPTSFNLVSFLNPTPGAISGASALNTDHDVWDPSTGEGGTVDQKLIVSAGPGGDPTNTNTAYTGMELFTAPQTLVNYIDPPNYLGDQPPQNTIRDNSRPFMTLKSFKASIVPTRGAMSTMTGELQLVLHDRTRLKDIADLVKPDFLNRIELAIEFGWSHPDPYNNPFGMLLHSLRNSQKWSPYNTSYQFGDSGQVDITLQLISKGTGTANWTDAAMTGKYKQNWEAIEVAMRAVQSLRRDVLGRPGIKDAAGTQQIATLSLGTTGLLLDADAMKPINEWIQAYASSGEGSAPADLATALGDLQGKVSTANATLQEDLTAKMNALKKGLANDPWALSADGDGNLGLCVSTSASAPYQKSTWKQAGRIVSFGKLCHYFLALPLAASGLYDEVQCVYYCANNAAGWAAGMNLGAFPIDLTMSGHSGTTFEKLLKAEYKTYGGQYPVTRLIHWVSENFVEQMYALGYGTTVRNNLGGRGVGGTGMDNMQLDDAGRLVPRDPPSDIGGTKQMNESRMRMAYYGEDDGSGKPAPFRPVNMKIHFEVLSGDADVQIERGVDPADAKKGASTRTVLRIHFCDAGASSNNPCGELLRAFRSTDTGVIDTDSSTRLYAGMNQEHYAALLEEIASAEAKTWSELASLGIITPFEGTQAPVSKTQKAAFQAKLTELEAKENPPASESDIAWMQLQITMQEKGWAPTNLYTLASNSPAALYAYFKGRMPYITYGSEGSLVKSLNVQTIADSKTASMYMVRAASNSSGDTAPDRGLPMEMMPVQMSAEIVGCPLVEYMQQYFVDLGTGTNLDNRYVITGIDHNVKPGSYSTSLKFTPLDAWASFRGGVSKLLDGQKLIQGLVVHDDGL